MSNIDTRMTSAARGITRTNTITEHGAVRAPVPNTAHGMIQVHTCVSVHCAQCGEALGSPGFEAHYATEDTALDAAAEAGWLVGPGERLWCSACGPVLTCEAEGHEFSQWRRPVIRDGQSAISEYRHCQRCCLHESRPAKTALPVADAELAKEVA
jgi:hypothetical protein